MSKRKYYRRRRPNTPILFLSGIAAGAALWGASKGFNAGRGKTDEDKLIREFEKLLEKNHGKQPKNEIHFENYYRKMRIK